MATELKLDERAQVVEIGSNDGCLLKYFQKRGIPVHGVDPAANVARVAVNDGVPTDATFFGRPYAEHLSTRGLNADLLIANNVLAHVPDINDFVAGLKLLLKPGGLITVEFPHLSRLIESVQFDTIYHEHVSYLSLATVQRIFAAHGLCVTDVEQLPTHGGSLRVFARHAESNPEVTGTVGDLIGSERARGLERLDTYRDFNRQLRVAKLSLLQFLLDAKLRGARIAGYGAPAKATTLLNFCGIDVDFIDFTVDRNPRKQHHFIPGTRIPILHPDAISMHRPDYVVIFPWNLRDEITQQLADIRRWGGQFVVPIPEVEVLP
jgi:SAM-dependent methyltransferase